MDVNEDKVAPWKVRAEVDELGCEENGGVGGGMKDVTTATDCAVSRRSARIFWERECLCPLILLSLLLLLLLAKSEEDLEKKTLWCYGCAGEGRPRHEYQNWITIYKVFITNLSIMS
jgi:hypothetical protein